MEGLLGQGVLSEGGGDCGNKVDPLRVYPIDTVESRDVVEERGLEEVPVLLENTTLCREEQEEGHGRRVAYLCSTDSWASRLMVMRMKFSI